MITQMEIVIIKNSWNLPKKIIDLNNIKQTKKIIENEISIMNNFNYDKNEMLKSMNDKINEFKKIDSLSDIKMLDYYNNNFKKYRLFQGRRYPSSRFIFGLTNNLLSKLNYDTVLRFRDTGFALQTGEPIPDYWYKFCKLEFENKHVIWGNIKISEWEWYYILLLSDNLNITNHIENRNYLIKIRRGLQERSRFNNPLKSFFGNLK